MRPIFPAVAAVALALAGCAETENPYEDSATTWVAEDFAGATLSFPETGRIAGKAPCNNYGGAQLADWPDFKVEGVFSTKMACPDLALEADFFDALNRATTASRDGDALLLSDGNGPLIRFTAE